MHYKNSSFSVLFINYPCTQSLFGHINLISCHKLILRRDKNKPKMAQRAHFSHTSESLKCTQSTLAPIIIAKIDVLDWRIDQQSPHAITGRQVHCTSVSCANALGEPRRRRLF